MKFQPESLGRRQDYTRLGLGKNGIGRVDEKRHDACRRKQLVQQLQPFRQYFFPQLGHASDVATGPIKAGDETKFDRVCGRFKNDRDGRGCRLCRERRWCAGRDNHRHVTINQIGRHRR